jgi:glycosyltransferase involved in cell wall biosynthesis
MITAGRGASVAMIEEFHRHGVEHVGEVGDLNDFFGNIDIFITTLRKECGILNKVLDAFAHKKIVLGLRHNMLAFKELHDGYYTYESIDEMISAIETIRNEPVLIEAMTQKAFAYIKEYHDWDKNYAVLRRMVASLGKAAANEGFSSQTLDR